MSAGESVTFRPKLLHLIAAVAIATIVAVFISYLVPTMRRQGWMLLCFVLVAVWDIYFLALIIFRPAVLRLDRHGVTHGLLWKRRTMPWSSIGKVHITGFEESTSIKLIAWGAVRRAESPASDPSLAMTISNRIVRIDIEEAAREICSRVSPKTEIIVENDGEAELPAKHDVQR